jgi:hypothetical protein
MSAIDPLVQVPRGAGGGSAALDVPLGSKPASIWVGHGRYAVRQTLALLASILRTLNVRPILFPAPVAERLAVFGELSITKDCPISNVRHGHLGGMPLLRAGLGMGIPVSIFTVIAASQVRMRGHYAFCVVSQAQNA